MTNQDVALALARAGFSVFPCGQDKKPIIPGSWREISTTDEATITKWWVGQRGALPAIDCHKSNLVVIDCDRHGDNVDGVEIFKKLCQEHNQPIDNLFIVTTMSNGEHVYFRQPNGEAFGNSRGRLPAGIDVRASGGYVIGVGAETASGARYKTNKPLTDIKEPLPEWLAQYLRPKAAPAAIPSPLTAPGGEREQAWAAAALDGVACHLAAVAPGARNETLNKAAFRLGTMAARGWINRSEIENTLANAAAACGLSGDDGNQATEKTITSGLNAGMKQPHADLDDRPKQDSSSKANQTDKPPRPPLTFIDLKAWEGQPVPERKWVVRDRIPDQEVTLLSGEGAIGKSLLVKQLGVATVTGKDWLYTMPEPGPVIYVTAEEKEDELHFRLHEIAVRYYGIRFADLGELHITSLKGEDSILAYPDRSGIIQPTQLFDRVFEAAQAIKPRWIGLDPVANLFAGNENDRSHVQQFIGLLTHIAVQCSTAVVLVSHPSLTGINTGSGLSGSTAWSNSVRSRLYLKKATTAEGDEPDPDLRQLEVMKANYGPVGECIRVRWRDGVFVPEQSDSGSFEQMARNQKADATFLMLLQRLTEQGQSINHKFGHSYAPARFAAHPEGAGLTSKAFAKAMQRLLDTKRIRIEQGGNTSRPTYRLVIERQS